MILSGSIVLDPGIPAWLVPLSTLCLVIRLESLFKMILTTAFRAHSRSVIGLVLFRSYSHSIGLGIGYTVVCLHSCGMSPRIKHIFANFQRALLASFPRCFSISLLIPVGPAALSFGRELTIPFHSSKSGGAIKLL